MENDGTLFCPRCNELVSRWHTDSNPRHLLVSVNIFPAYQELVETVETFPERLAEVQKEAFLATESYEALRAAAHTPKTIFTLKAIQWRTGVASTPTATQWADGRTITLTANTLTEAMDKVHAILDETTEGYYWRCALHSIQEVI